MSDTPETDAVRIDRIDVTMRDGGHLYVDGGMVSVEHARKLERERNKAEAGWLECRNFAQRIVDERDRYKSEVEVITRERDEALNKAHNYEQGYLTHAARADTLEKEREALAQICQAISYLSMIAEDCDGWLNNQCDETECKFIKTVRGQAKKNVYKYKDDSK